MFMNSLVILSAIMLMLCRSSAFTLGARSFRKTAVQTLSMTTSTTVEGAKGTESYRMFFNTAGDKISPWHDIPLKAADDELFNFVVEIPKYTKEKMEVATKEAANPIAQDIKKGKLRDYHGPIFWNYGCLPQTWEDPNIEHPVVKCFGDNDPVDVVEIGSKALACGTVNTVKVLGVLAMIDDGELDWKVVAIDSEDEMASKLNDIDDVETHMPGVISGIREWFRWYKTPDGKPLNSFGFDEVCLGRKDALEVIEETHGHWKALKAGASDAGKLWLK